MKKIPNLPKIKSGDRLFYSPDDNEKDTYKKINKELKKKYNINLVDRDTIIKNIIVMLTQGNYNNHRIPDFEWAIIRTDISNFYNSINKHALYKKISHSNMLSRETLNNLKPLFFSDSVKGVPLGLPFSSSLSEIYLEDFDKDIIIYFNPIFYFRYVDDIIILLHNSMKSSEEKKIVESKNKEKLDFIFYKYNLIKNEKKTKFNYYRKKSKKEILDFEYLGYHFKSNNSELIIDISDVKKEKILRQINHYFGIFKNSSHSDVEFWKLYYRLQHTLHGITSNNEFSNSLHFGVAFSYKYINSTNQLNKLIKHTQYLIYKCKLTSYKKFMLLQLIEYKESVLEILDKKYNYQNITPNQLNIMKKRLHITTKDTGLKKIFFIIHGNKYK